MVITPLLPPDGFPLVEWKVVLGTDTVGLVAKADTHVLASASAPLQLRPNDYEVAQAHDVIEVLKRLRTEIEKRLKLVKTLGIALGDIEIFSDEIEVRHDDS